MSVIEMSDLTAPELEPFRGMRNRNWVEQSGIFIAEGPLLVERLLQSDYRVHSVLVDRKYLDAYRARVPEETQLLVVEHDQVEQLVGYNFHRGVLACGLRKPPKSLAADFAPIEDPHETLLAVVGVQDPENLGGILRNCAGLGIQRIVIGPGTADPLSRRVLRVSMGNALRLQLFRSRALLEDLQHLKASYPIELVATSLEAGSQPLESATRSRAIMVLVGNEKYGLPKPVQACADRLIKIGMDLGTDSLNVCVASGIVLHYFSRLAPVQSGRT